jgi:pimeloyl-ACP methyl ester carboxylesterase
MRVARGVVGVYVDLAGPPTGAPVLFLHGVTSSGVVWDWLPSPVTDNRRIVKVDFRGHGRSDRAAGTYRRDVLADDVVAVLREAVGSPAILVGHSLGGAVAWTVAQRHPGLVTALFLEDPPLFADAQGPDARGALELALVRMRTNAEEWQRAGMSLQEIAQRLAGEPSAGTPGRTMAAVLTEDAITASAFNLKHLDVRVIDAALDGSMLAGLDPTAPVAAPLFVLAADEAYGAVFTPAHAKLLAASHPHAEVVHLAAVGHRIHLERRGRPAFTRHLVDFLARHA